MPGPEGGRLPDRAVPAKRLPCACIGRLPDQALHVKRLAERRWAIDGRRSAVFHLRPSEAMALHPAQQWLTPTPRVPLSARARNGAKADQGRRLFERSEFPADPAFVSTAAVPEGPRAVGSPFLSLVSFGEAKESDPPPGGSRPQLHASGSRTPSTRHSQRKQATSANAGTTASQAARDPAGDHRKPRTNASQAARDPAGEHRKRRATTSQPQPDQPAPPAHRRTPPP